MKVSIKKLTEDHLDAIIALTKILNSALDTSILLERQKQMFQLDHYHCFGFYDGEKLVGLSSGWVTIRLYSGKQLELDNVIIHPSERSKGYGKVFLRLLEDWAMEHGCQTVELNTYVGNSRSHKFYFNEGYTILGFHFQKHLTPAPSTRSV